MSQAVWWAQVCPAEFIWPNIFLSCDREIIDSLRQELDKERQIAEQSTYAVAMESELVQRLRKQIRWLGLQLADRKPPEIDCSSCFGWFPDAPHRRDGRCAECWEQASLKATKEEGYA